MESIEQAKSAGFTKVRTLAGLISLENWEPKENLNFENGALLGNWRPLNPFEKEIARERGYDLAETQARDRFELS